MDQMISKDFYSLKQPLCNLLIPMKYLSNPSIPFLFYSHWPSNQLLVHSWINTILISSHYLLHSPFSITLIDLSQTTVLHILDVHIQVNVYVQVYICNTVTFVQKIGFVAMQPTCQGARRAYDKFHICTCTTASSTR